jgi:hypothetical protein
MNDIINNSVKVHPQIWRFFLSSLVSEHLRFCIKLLSLRI